MYNVFGLVREIKYSYGACMYMYIPYRKKTSLDFNFALLLMSNSLNLNSAYYCVFRNLPMIAYIIEIQKLKFANI